MSDIILPYTTAEQRRLQAVDSANSAATAQLSASTGPAQFIAGPTNVVGATSPRQIVSSDLTPNVTFRQTIYAGFFYDTNGRNLSFYHQMSNLANGNQSSAVAAFPAIRSGSITGYSWIADGTMAAGGVSIAYVQKNGALYASGTASGAVSKYSDTFTRGQYPFNAGDYLGLFISWNNNTTGAAIRLEGYIEIECGS